MKRTSAIVALVALAFIAGSAWAYNPPTGGEASGAWVSPLSSGGTASVVSNDGPASSFFNPAAEAANQRFTLDASYLALVGLGAVDGWGSAANLQATMPTSYGVWGAGIHLYSLPAALAPLPLGTQFSAHGSFAKALWPDFWLGMGVKAGVGSNGLLDWALAADLGFIHKPGNISFMKDFRWGLVAANLGKWYSPGSDAATVGDVDSAYPSPFTLKAGAAFDLVKVPAFRWSFSGDLGFPIFQNVLLDLGTELSIKEAVSLRVGWGMNMREVMRGAYTPSSWYPSFALNFSIPVTAKGADDSFLSKQGWNRSELKPTISAEPLIDDIWAFGLGVTMPLGVIDRTPPKIELRYPDTPHDMYYISPNADGKNDALSLGLSIRDERFVDGYSLTVANEAGEPVRTIVNKQPPLPAEGIKAFWSRLVKNEKGIPVPETISWDGRTDTGAIAPDGVYTITIEALDDNGNKAVAYPVRSATDDAGAATKVEIRKVAVDSTPPALTMKAPADLVFSPDSDGNKDTITFPLSGSSEDRWSVKILDAAGAVVRTLDVTGQALSAVTWDGKTDSGAVAPDGFYRLSASATDRAQNTVAGTIDNILVDTRQPPVSLAIDTAAFSPNRDGSRDAITFQPSAPVKTGLVSWVLLVKDSAGNEKWRLTGEGAESLRSAYVFEGKDASGSDLKEGGYQAFFRARYANGYEPEAVSPAFVLDITPPSAKVSADLAAFSPNGDGKQDTVTFSQETSAEDLWLGEVADASGKTVITFRYTGKADATQVWDGTDQQGARAPDGIYSYRLRATDRAGNSGASAPVRIQLDTEKKSVMLSTDFRAFSPNKDGVRDSLTLIPSVQNPERVSEWRISIADSAGRPVRTWSGKGNPAAKYSWDGTSNEAKALPDGSYTATLWVKYASGDEISAAAPAVSLDTVAPSLDLAAAYTAFSPDGDGKKDVISFTQRNSSPDEWEGAILDAKGQIVRTWPWKAGAGDFSWDGKDAAGNVVPDGRYRYRVSAEDRAGNKGERSIEGIAVDTRATDAFVTASRPGFSPNGDGVMDDVSFSFVVRLREGISSWKFQVLDSAGSTPRRSWSGAGTTAPLPAKIDWDGKGDDGKVVQGTFVGVLSLVYDKGNEPEARSAPVILDIDPPVLRTGVAPKPFSPDNDGVDDEVNIALSVRDASEIASWKLEIMETAVSDSSDSPAKARVFMRYEGSGRPAEKITWDGKSLKGELVESATDYLAVLTVTDALGNSAKTETLIPVDVLVMRDGDRMRIIIPSIVFRPNAGDFNGLEEDIIAKNQWVLKRIADILNRYRTYSVTIEGYANNIGKIYGYSADRIQKEENTEVLPLSKARAEAVRTYLISLGVASSRLTAAGMGSARPVVDPRDAENRWKNRRVEFILQK